MKKIVLGFFLFSLLYFETLAISGVKIAILWKGLFTFALLAVVINCRLRGLQRSLAIGYLFAVVVFISSTLSSSPGQGVSEAIKYLIFPLFAHFLMARNVGIDKIDKAMKFVAIFLVVSTAPFHLGLLKPISDGYSIEAYGLDGEGFVGIFQNSHGASIVYSVIAVFAYWQTFVRKEQFYIWSSVLVAALLTVYFTYVRTGLAMFVLGVVVLSFRGGMAASLRRMIVVVGIVSIAVSTLVQTNELFRARLLDGETIYSEGSEIEDRIGSGRLGYGETYLGIFNNGSTLEKIIGVGEGEALNRMESEYGRRLAAHNGFIDVLVRYGAVGVSIFLIFLGSLSKHMFNKQVGALAETQLFRAILVSYLVSILVQGTNNFLLDIIFSLIYVWVLKACSNSRFKVRALESGSF